MPSRGEVARPLTPSERSRFQEGQFEMRSLALTLTNDHGEQRFQGPGSVSMDPKGDLSFTLFDSEADPSIGLKWVFRGRGWIADEEYFHLEICDPSGRRWTASEIVPELEQGSVGVPGMIIRGSLSELRHEGIRDAEGSPSVRAHFPGFVRLPLFLPTRTITERGGQKAEGWTRDHQEYESAGFKAQIDRDGDGFSVRVKPPKSMESDAPHLRVEESIWLLLGTPLHASVVETWTTAKYEVRIRRRKPPRFKPRLEPPIPVRDPRFVEAHERLVCQYLSFVWDLPGGSYHPVSTRIFDVLRASSLSVVAEARAVSIAVEAVAKRFLEGFAPVSKAQTEMISELTDHISGWRGDEKLRERVAGAMANFHKPRARDVLEALKKRGLVSREEVKAWTRLRNASAHGDDPTGSITEFADRSEQVWGLLTKLVFQVIGFEGEWIEPGSSNRAPTRFSPVGGMVRRDEKARATGES